MQPSFQYSLTLSQCVTVFFCGGRGVNPEPYIYYVLSLSIELNSQEPQVTVHRRNEGIKNLAYAYIFLPKDAVPLNSKVKLNPK